MTYIVAVRVLYESESIVSDLVDELDFLVIRCVINTALEDAAAMTVSGNFNTVGSNRIINELVENESKKRKGGKSVRKNASHLDTRNCYFFADLIVLRS